ncbi:MAG TPA: hypothetical protein PKD73_17650 [Burkholderiaceae bacterium]|nr:hypothetical protein [Burkholderiaceae bacterium]
MKKIMIDFIPKQLPYDLSNQAGLALIGKYLKRINLNALVDPRFPVRSGIANSDVRVLAVQGKPQHVAFDALGQLEPGAGVSIDPLPQRERRISVDTSTNLQTNPSMGYSSRPVF